MKLLIADPIHTDAISKLTSAGFDVLNSPEITTDELLSSIGEYEALIVRGRTKVTKDVIDRATRLKFIGRVGSGVDNIDINSANTKGIIVSNAAGANATAVAELTLGLMLSLLRKIPYADKSTKAGEWLKKQLKGGELQGKTVGIVGYGNIGQKVARLVEAFGASVLSHDKNDDQTNLEKLFSSSDIVTVHSVLVDQTRGLVNNLLLSRMKPNAYFINCARAEIVVEDDLFDILSQKKIAGAAIDVFWVEPIPADSKWLTLENIILTPHIGGQTHEASQQASMIIAENLIEYSKGKSAD